MHFLYYYLNDLQISCFIFISSQELLSSLSRTKVSRQRLASPNRKLNGNFDFVLGRRLFFKRESCALELIDYMEDVDYMKVNGTNTLFSKFQYILWSYYHEVSCA